MTQGRLISGRDPSCEVNAIEFVPLLSDYRPALDYCSLNFPNPHSSINTVLTITVIVPPNGITTLSETVDGGTSIVPGTTSTVVETSTVTNTNPTTSVATATSAGQRRDTRLIQPEHENNPGHLRNANNDVFDETEAYGLADYRGRPNNGGTRSVDDLWNSHHGHNEIFETKYGDAVDDYESDEDDYDSSGYGESVDGTWYPALDSEPTKYGGPSEPSVTLSSSLRPSDSASSAAFLRFRALPNASQSLVCSCLENRATTYPTSTGPLTVRKTATVTSTDEDLPLVPTATVSEMLTLVSTTTATATTVTSTTTTVVFTGPTVTCIANPASNILINGGFDDNTADEWGEVDPRPWGFDGSGWGPMFFGPRTDAQTPPNYAEFPGDDDGARFHMWQDSTNINIRLNYTVSFWYKLSGLRAEPYDPDYGHGPCSFTVTWGNISIFTKGFNEDDVSSNWKHINSPIDLSQESSTARLEFDMYCEAQWLGGGYMIFLIDSVVIYPSNELVCDTA